SVYTIPATVHPNSLKQCPCNNSPHCQSYSLCLSLSCTHARTHTRAHTHTHRRAHAHTHTRKQTHTQTDIHRKTQKDTDTPKRHYICTKSGSGKSMSFHTLTEQR